MVATAADKGKKQKVGDGESDVNEDAVLFSLEKLQEFQEQLDKINEEASDEIMTIEQKYNALRKPVYEKRNEVTNTIPDFWLTAFLSHPVLGDLLSDEDQKIFRYLSSLEVDDYTDMNTGYSISFVFKPNPYFEDKKLTKTFKFFEGASQITVTKIKWKEGMGIPNGVADEKIGNKRPPADESFFTWFSESESKSDTNEFQDEIADIIKEDLWANPLTYFNNEGDEEDFDGEEGDEEENGSDSQEEDDGEEDE